MAGEKSTPSILFFISCKLFRPVKSAKQDLATKRLFCELDSRLFIVLLGGEANAEAWGPDVMFLRGGICPAWRMGKSHVPLAQPSEKAYENQCQYCCYVTSYNS